MDYARSVRNQVKEMVISSNELPASIVEMLGYLKFDINDFEEAYKRVTPEDPLLDYHNCEVKK